MSPVSFRPAVRENVRLLIGVAGGTGAGKTMSALRLATGLSGGQRFALIDTENGRALEYADLFQFDHGDLRAPFTPAAYIEAIKAADEAGYPVIVVDSASHEHAGDGGLLDMHEKELTRMAGDDWKKREQATFAAWVKPKGEHKHFVNTLLQVRAHVILALRAEEKIELVRSDKGKLEVIPKRAPGKGIEGWLPIAEKNLPYELTISLLLTNEQRGVPKPIKISAVYEKLVPLTEQLSEATGRRLAEYAAGADKTSGDPVGEAAVTGSGPPSPPDPVPDAPEPVVLDPAQHEDPAGEPSEPIDSTLPEPTGAADATGQAASPAITIEAALQMTVPEKDMRGAPVHNRGKTLEALSSQWLEWVLSTSPDRWDPVLLSAIGVVLEERAKAAVA